MATWKRPIRIVCVFYANVSIATKFQMASETSHQTGTFNHFSHFKIAGPAGKFYSKLLDSRLNTSVTLSSTFQSDKMINIQKIHKVKAAHKLQSLKTSASQNKTGHIQVQKCTTTQVAVFCQFFSAVSNKNKTGIHSSINRLPPRAFILLISMNILRFLTNFFSKMQFIS